jgi:hypothetical protein
MVRVGHYEDVEGMLRFYSDSSKSGRAGLGFTEHKAMKMMKGTCKSEEFNTKPWSIDSGKSWKEILDEWGREERNHGKLQDKLWGRDKDESGCFLYLICLWGEGNYSQFKNHVGFSLTFINPATVNYIL